MNKLVLSVGGVKHDFITLGELAKLSGKTSDALKKLMKRGLLPDSNLRTPPSKVTSGERIGETIEGNRIYTVNIIVPILVPLLKQITQGKKIEKKLQLEIYEAFEIERQKLKI